LDIIVAILGMVEGGATKTKIVYGANLNFNLATKYLDLLEEKRLIRVDSRVYEITKEGETFLKKAKELQI